MATSEIDMKLQAEKLTKKLDRLFKATWLDDKQVKDILATASTPMEDALQSDYLAADPSGMNGRMKIFVTIKQKTKKFGTIYIGPDTKISKGWQLWWLLDKGFVHKKNKKNGSATTTVVAGKNFRIRAFNRTVKTVTKNAIKEFEKRLKEYAKKTGLEVK